MKKKNRHFVFLIPMIDYYATVLSPITIDYQPLSNKLKKYFLNRI